eukprot:TRINITY_DN19166_c0_g2_i1.p1 TRINITY_DN19166_c0_g2~~TRINITY_DN19166_c0_g2_i1.p1  ORF type:complete len:164 (+),score=8.01 TRINITY_DN19166_c0_g2_i1:242-733(+)
MSVCRFLKVSQSNRHSVVMKCIFPIQIRISNTPARTFSCMLRTQKDNHPRQDNMNFCTTAPVLKKFHEPTTGQKVYDFFFPSVYHPDGRINHYSCQHYVLFCVLVVVIIDRIKKEFFIDEENKDCEKDEAKSFIDIMNSFGNKKPTINLFGDKTSTQTEEKPK